MTSVGVLRRVGIMAVALLGAGALLRDHRADACGWVGASIAELTTFDPAVAGESVGASLDYDPDVGAVGFRLCGECARAAMLTDWAGYLPSAVAAADWERLLFSSSPSELTATAAYLAGKSLIVPDRLPSVAGWTRPAHRDAVLAAVRLVELARRIEPFASGDELDAEEFRRLLAEAKAGWQATAAPFLKQRYGFQVLRLLFYRRDWGGLVSFYDQHRGPLSAPSSDLAWRARYYLAGALRRGDQGARANLELARIFGQAPSLAAAAANDFRPRDDAEWQASLRLAGSAAEKAQLWRLVGITQDGLVAAEEIRKLDPRSNLLGLLVVRELNRAESVGAEPFGGTVSAEALAARTLAYGRLEQLATRVLAAPGADRPWLMHLVLGHLAAKRGDVVAARAAMRAAIAGRPGDARVASQARASLAIALAQDWKIERPREDELAQAMNQLDQSFGRRYSVSQEVRNRLATAYVAAGKIVDAELLQPGVVDPTASSFAAPADLAAMRYWNDAGFIRQMIARTSERRTPFDRFLLSETYTKPTLEKELALRYLVAGDFAAAARTFATTGAPSRPLGTDPFVAHVVDCHDCDHDTYRDAKWTHANFAARLAALGKVAKGKGEAAAKASLELGTAMYNVTWYGNARSVLENTHQATFDAAPAERWYERAFKLTKSRELKARAAFFAAKAELAQLITPSFRPYDSHGPLPVPERWYPVVKQFSDTRYYREILRECGAFRTWVEN